MQRHKWERFSAEDKEEAVRMYAAGKTIREIAQWLGRPVGSVWTILSRDAGVTMRPRGGRAKEVKQ